MSATFASQNILVLALQMSRNFQGSTGAKALQIAEVARRADDVEVAVEVVASGLRDLALRSGGALSDVLQVRRLRRSQQEKALPSR